MRLATNGALALGAAALAVAFSAGASAEAPPAPKALLAFSGGEGEPTRLVRLDPLTLRRLPGRAVSLGESAGPWTFSPDGERLAVGDRGVDGLRIVDIRRMRLLGALRSGTAFWAVQPVAWLEPRRLLAFRGPPDGGATELLAIDPTIRRPVARRPFTGVISTWATSRRRLVLLQAMPGRIAPARVLVADPSGATRELTVDRAHVGWFVEDEEQHRMRHVTPGLAVDPDRERAFVIAADAPLVAEIDLDTSPSSTTSFASPARSSAGSPRGSSRRRRRSWCRGRHAMLGGSAKG